MSMRTSLRLVRLGVLLAVGLGALARAETPQEDKRDKILKELGLKKKQQPAPAEGTAAPPGGEPASTTEAEKPDKGEKPNGPAPGGGPAAPSFGRTIYPALLATCKPCHSPVGPAAASHLLFSGDPAADHRALGRFVDVHAPEASSLLMKVSGATLHAGGPLWPAASPTYQKALAWIRGGARLDTAAAAAAAAAPAQATAPQAPPGAKRSSLPGETTQGPIPSGEPRPLASPPGSEQAVPSPPRAVIAAEPPRVGAPTFAATVHPILKNTCALCHRSGGPAAMTRLLLSGDPAADEAAVRRFLDPQAPEQSVLVAKASGQMHAGGAVIRPGDPRLATIVEWVRGLAPPAAATAPEAGARAVGTSAPPVISAGPPPPPPAPGYPGLVGAPGGSGLALPLGFMLNGRFDLNYQRGQFNSNPFATGSAAALRSYHHFLFLSRDAGDPCGISVEVLTLLFWEGHCRLPHGLGPLAVTIAGGKIVVPFGADPLFHQSYGGLAGFDQVVLPPVWAIEGAAVHAVLSRGELAFTDDLYVVRGYALAHANSVINLQSDFSPDDDTRLAFGNRLGAAWMGLSAWYSSYFNPLGFGRRLFMQAIDLNVWRQRRIPVLGHFSFGAGLLRADVSGGGPGVGGVGYDYYHFADYLQVRYYPLDWLFLQYRAGLHTFDNRRALVVDNSRLTPADGSSHNFGIVARTRSLWLGLFYFINLEKVDEIPNDLLRVDVTYEF
jgi:hypothetical protein